jgi:Resolvase, N terminal domain
MSTEHQQYSIANQSDVIRQYAQDHKMRIVRTYDDAGKSGLTRRKRGGLNAVWYRQELALRPAESAPLFSPHWVGPPVYYRNHRDREHARRCRLPVS